MTGHRNIIEARQRARELAASVPEAPKQMARAVRRMARMSQNMMQLFRAARVDPYNETIHGAIADAIEEEYPDSPFPRMIRNQFPTTSETGDGANNIWHPEFENSWDGTFPYAARLGSHGPFDLYLNHEGYVNRDSSVPSTNQRWVLHAVVRPNRGDWVGYSFEIPHSDAWKIPDIAPAAEKHISPLPFNNATVGHSQENIRNYEARRFIEAMDNAERERQNDPETHWGRHGTPQDEGG